MRRPVGTFAALGCLLAVALGAEPARAAAPGPIARTLRSASAAGAILPVQARAWRADVARARATARRLGGVRGSELAAVVADVERLAATRQLTVGRMPLAFLTVRRNERFWRTRPMPAPGGRVTFGRDPAVFQFFRGHGMQFHGLATAGTANALAKPCVARAERVRRRVAARAQLVGAARRRGSLRRAGPTRRPPLHAAGCRPGRLAATLDRLARLSAGRDGFLAFEYQFDYGVATAPWVSGMTQATAAQALARGSVALGEARYRVAALSALGAFDAPPPTGVGLRRAGGGREYLLYSFDPGLHVLNGFLQSLVGLHDVAELTGSPKARRLFDAGDRVARAGVAAFDTGAWSRYSLAGRESTLAYHQLVTGFLEGLCERTDRAVYCDAGDRFARYEREPPRIRIARAAPRLREDRPTSVTFALSKVSETRLSVTGPKGEALSVDTRLTRGRFTYGWTPPAGGSYRVAISATGPEGRTGVARATLRVRAKPRPKPKPKRTRKRKPPTRVLLGSRVEAGGG